MMLAILPVLPEPVCGIPHFGLMPTGAVFASKDEPRRAAGARCSSCGASVGNRFSKKKVEPNLAKEKVTPGIRGNVPAKWLEVTKTGHRYGGICVDEEG